MGPLSGFRVIEISGQGPGPWCAMMLSDMGAEVLRVERADAVGTVPEGELEPQFVNLRGRRSIAVDLKKEGGPVPPLNLVGDFGGGGLLVAFGIVSDILEARSSGTGQVIDAAMVDGSALLGGMFYGLARSAT